MSFSSDSQPTIWGRSLPTRSRWPKERFSSGYDLSEVQSAFNALEEATWTSVFRALDASAFAEAIRLISTVLGAGKDALARRYVSLATDHRVTSLDVRSLFGGGYGEVTSSAQERPTRPAAGKPTATS